MRNSQVMFANKSRVRLTEHVGAKDTSSVLWEQQREVTLSQRFFFKTFSPRNVGESFVWVGAFVLVSEGW